VKQVELEVVAGKMFVFTTFITLNSKSGKLLHLSLLMFFVECGRK
jgi:hypothetical protein